MKTPDEQCPTQAAPQRYSREIDAIAPKPGRDLGTLTYSNDETSALLRVIEGGTRDAMSFRGMSTDFTATRPLNFHVRGNWVDLFEDLPYSPYDLETTIEYENLVANEFRSVYDPAHKGMRLEMSPLNLDLKSAKAIYSRIASERGQDPDGALIKLMTGPGKAVLAQLTGIKRGWCPIATIAVVGIVALTIIELSDRHPNIRVTGGVQVANFKTNFELEAGSGPATASVRESASDA